ncbi:hypothetical protein D3C76_366120 [compost metagenome]
MSFISARLHTLLSLIRAACIHPALGTSAHPNTLPLALDPFFGPALHEQDLGTTASARSYP